MQAQEIFDAVSKHLFNQGRRSMRLTSRRGMFFCAYRGNNGLKCAVGALISDEIYNPDMDIGYGNDIFSIIRLFNLPDWFRRNDLLLKDLQNVHDNEFNWENDDIMKSALSEVARKFELDSSILGSLSFKSNRGD